MQLEATLATVTNIADPAKGGAVKVVMQDIGGDEYPEWIEPVFPAGCWFCMPEVGDTVVVLVPAGEDMTEFSEEVRYVGRLIAEGEGLPASFKTNYPTRRGFETKKGHQLILDDTTGDWLIKTFKGKHEVNLKGDGTIEIKSGQSAASIVISTSGDVTVKGVALVHLDSPTTDLNGTPTDFLVKGTKFFLDFVTTFLAAWTTAIGDASGPPIDPNWIAYKAAMAGLLSTLVANAATWISTTTRTS